MEQPKLTFDDIGLASRLARGQEADPLPVDAATVSFRYKRFLIPGFQRQLEDARDPLIVLQVSDVDSPLKIEIFRLESDRSSRKSLRYLSFLS